MANSYRVLFNKVGNFRSMAALFFIGCIVIGCIVMAGTGQEIGKSGSMDTGSGNGSVSREYRMELGGRRTAGTSGHGPLLEALLPRTDTAGEQHTVLPQSEVQVRVRREAFITPLLISSRYLLPHLFRGNKTGNVGAGNGSVIEIHRSKRAFPLLVPIIAALANIGPVTAGVAAGTIAGVATGAVGAAIGQAEAAAREELEQDYLDIGSGDYPEYAGESDYSDDDILWQKVNEEETEFDNDRFTEIVSGTEDMTEMPDLEPLWKNVDRSKRSVDSYNSVKFAGIEDLVFIPVNISHVHDIENWFVPVKESTVPRLYYSLTDDYDYEDDEDVTSTGNHEIVREKRGLGELIQTGADIASATGTVKQFLVDLVGPVFKGLHKDGNTGAIRSFTKKVLPWTGYNAHKRGHEVRDFIKENNFQGVLDSFQSNMVEFNPRGLWAKEKPSTVSDVYRQTRRILPHLDSILVERLRSTTAVTTSLIQAVVRDVKELVSKDMTQTADKLGEILGGAKQILEVVQEVFNHNDRIVVCALLGAVLVVCLVSMYWVYRTMKMVERRLDAEAGKRVRTDQVQYVPNVVHYDAEQQRLRNSHLMAIA